MVFLKEYPKKAKTGISNNKTLLSANNPTFTTLPSETIKRPIIINNAFIGVDIRLRSIANDIKLITTNKSNEINT